MPNVILKKISTKMEEKWRKSGIETKLPVVIRFAKKGTITYDDPDESISESNDSNFASVPDPSFSCEFCQVSFKTNVSFQRHRNAVHQLESYCLT